MDILDQIFGTGASITTAQEVARAVLIFFYGLFLLRVTGSRTFGRWSALDIIVSVVAGSSLSRALTGNAPLGGTLAAVSALVAIHWVLARGVARFETLSRWVEGVPVNLVSNGEVLQQNLRANGVSKTDLSEALRHSGIGDVRLAALAILEPSGKISVAKRE